MHYILSVCDLLRQIVTFFSLVTFQSAHIKRNKSNAIWLQS